MAWTAPSTTGNIDYWNLFTQANPGQQQTAENFLQWYNTGGGASAIANAYNSAWQPWIDLETTQLQDQPDAVNFDDINQWSQGQLYGTPENESGGIYDFMEALQAEMAAGAGQYQADWSQTYATNAGFGTPEERDAYLQQQRDLQAQFQGGMEDPSMTPEQQKAVRAQAAEAEARSRKQAEAMFQETGSYAVLQRASDEMNRANVNDQFKQTMELERENFARALSGVNQQTEIIMREVEAGERSFAFYVEAKQRGVAAALQGWQERAGLVLQETQQKLGTRQQEYDNEMAAWQAEADAIHQAAVLAMGGDRDLMGFMEQFYESTLTPMIQEIDLQLQQAGDQATRDAGGITVAIGAVALILGFIPGMQWLWGVGAGALLSGIQQLAGAPGGSTPDYAALARAATTAASQT